MARRATSAVDKRCPQHLVALAVLALLASTAAAGPSAGGPTANGPPPGSGAAAPAGKRFAYVTIHYEGTPGDAEYILGIRVLLKSLQPLRHPFLILASDSVSESSRTLFRSEGATIVPVKNIENPFEHVLARFSNTFNKLHLWNLTDYDRVIYFDADNIAMDRDRVDELFLCGWYCVVYMNHCHHHTGVMVIKPDAAKFSTMVHELANTGSYDGADQGFLSAFFESCREAPMFNPSKGQSQDEMNVLHIGYNMHALYYLPRGNFEIFGCSPFRERSDFVPATIGYPLPPIIKPWYWWTYPVIGHAQDWHRVRATLDEPSVLLDLVLRLAVVAAVMLAGRTLRPPPLPRSIARYVVRAGPYGSGVVLGLACVVLAFKVAIWWTPLTARPLHGAVVYTTTHLVVFLTLARLVAVSAYAHPGPPPAAVPVWSLRQSVCAFLFFYAHELLRPVYLFVLGPGVAVAIVTVFAGMAAILVTQLQVVFHLALSSPLFMSSAPKA